jgi:hypothetical protein
LIIANIVVPDVTGIRPALPTKFKACEVNISVPSAQLTRTRTVVQIILSLNISVIVPSEIWTVLVSVIVGVEGGGVAVGAVYPDRENIKLVEQTGFGDGVGVTPIPVISKSTSEHGTDGVGVGIGS